MIWLASAAALIVSVFRVFDRRTRLPATLALLLLLFGAIGAQAWNWAKENNGSGIPSELTADTSYLVAGAPFAWAALGISLGTLRRPKEDHSNHPIAGLRMLNSISSPLLLLASAVTWVFWAFGQGPSLFYREVYLATDGNETIHRATTLPGPLLGLAVFVVVLLIGKSGVLAHISNLLLLLLWYCSVLSLGSRMAVVLIAGSSAALVVKLARRLSRTARISLVIVAVPLICRLCLFTFSTTLDVRFEVHGLRELSSILTAENFWKSFFNSTVIVKQLQQMVSSIVASAVIVQQSVVNHPDASVLWSTADPLPQAITHVDTFSQERLWPYDWVPLAMLGEWYGAHGAVGQVLLYFFITLLYFRSKKAVSRSNSAFFGLLVNFFFILSVVASIQYQSRIVWRAIFMLLILPFVQQILPKRARKQGDDEFPAARSLERSKFKGAGEWAMVQDSRSTREKSDNFGVGSFSSKLS